ncbi:MAG: DNA polymerase III subunit epsilon [Alphaproteobacteria bacterium]|nr:DNA polymerase III subunit epsilon [Alphaproteobacteria bacterium]
MRQIILDTETTGLNAETGDRIVEIGCVELLHRKLSGNNLHHYLNPERDSEEGALRVHGLTREFLDTKPKFAAIAQELRDYLQGVDELISHNAPFDIGFLNKEFQLLGLGPVTELVGRVLDSLAMAKELYPGKRNGLDALCDRLGVDNSGRTLHGALLDAELLAEVYIGMTRGQDVLLMDLGSGGEQGGAGAAWQDLRQFHLPVIEPSAAELEQHEAVLQQMDKSSGGKVVFRQVSNMA